MAYISDHLSSLSKEISGLRDRNALYSQQSQHSPVERTAAEARGNRLLQIQQELLKMRNPPDPTVWWAKSRKPSPTV
jgi:hypothetical protein